MKDSHLNTLLQLRLVVGFLGERAQFSWWPTAFFESASRPFLEPVFARSFRLAQYHGVVEAARRLHDEHLNVGSYHLFRLPEETEQDLHALVRSSVGEELAAAMSHANDTALAALKRLAPTGAKSSEGPTAVGRIKDIDSPDALKAMAGAYFSAFSRNFRTYPYLMG
jgi:hypothetical protein